MLGANGRDVERHGVRKHARRRSPQHQHILQGCRSSILILGIVIQVVLLVMIVWRVYHGLPLFRTATSSFSPLHTCTMYVSSILYRLLLPGGYVAAAVHIRADSSISTASPATSKYTIPQDASDLLAREEVLYVKPPPPKETAKHVVHSRLTLK